MTANDPVSPSASLPTGTVTLLFTDIEGSTRSWEAIGARDGRGAGAARVASADEIVFDRARQEARALTVRAAMSLAMEKTVERP